MIPLGKIGLSLLGMSVPVMKEVVEMLYLTVEPVVLSGDKYKTSDRTDTFNALRARNHGYDSRFTGK
ncbi:hypothetical protein HMSSN036_22390 [Paenibacillus macerans]|nr:hypothetical protein HMSSN036_22390 [Paenibacillus macerans]